MATKQPQNLTEIPTEVKKKAKADKKAANRAKHDAEMARVVEHEAKLALPNNNGTMTPPPVIGRPSMYSDALADELCAHLAMGKSLNKTCQLANMPSMVTVFNWIHSNPDFLNKYTRAKAEAADAMAEDILDIADNPEPMTMTYTRADGTIETRVADDTNHRRLRIETRKFIMAKMKPKKYGEKLDLTSGGDKLPTPLLANLTIKLPENPPDDINTPKELPE